MKRRWSTGTAKPSCSLLALGGNAINIATASVKVETAGDNAVRNNTADTSGVITPIAKL